MTTDTFVKHKAFLVRLYPNQKQEEQFKQFAGCTRFVYNWGLEQWKSNLSSGKLTSTHSLSLELTALKQDPEKLWLGDCSIVALQASLADLGEAFMNFFAKRTGFPNFKKKNVRDSFRIVIRERDAWRLDQESKHVDLPKIGPVKFRGGERAITGTVKAITVSRKADKWFASIQTSEEVTKPEPVNDRVLGLDVGIAKLATTYDGAIAKVYEMPASILKEEAKLKKLQRKLSRKTKGSKNREKARIKVANQHLRIASIRKDTLHKVSSDIAKNHGYIALEALRIKQMLRSAKGTVDEPGKNVAAKRGLNRSIARQGWYELARMIHYKTNWDSGTFVTVNPHYTSLDCPVCKYRDKLNRPSQANFTCLACGYHNNADIVAAMNIHSRVSIPALKAGTP